jgi:hypothetical protein
MVNFILWSIFPSSNDICVFERECMNVFLTKIYVQNTIGAEEVGSETIHHPVWVHRARVSIERTRHLRLGSVLPPIDHRAEHLNKKKGTRTLGPLRAIEIPKHRDQSTVWFFLSSWAGGPCDRHASFSGHKSFFSGSSQSFWQDWHERK